MIPSTVELYIWIVVSSCGWFFFYHILYWYCFSYIDESVSHLGFGIWWHDVLNGSGDSVDGSIVFVEPIICVFIQ